MKTTNTNYRDTPLLKPPVWTWEVPLYFFVGGIAGVCAIIAAAARLLDPTFAALARDAAWAAAIGGALSGPLLIADLGRPMRFLYMLRVFKPQSPMSVGVWTLVVFSTSAVAALLPLGIVATLASWVAAVSGAVLVTYTGVLIGATVIPVWSRNVDALPVHFAASALGAGVSVLELLGHRTGAMNALGIAAAVTETLLMLVFLSRGSSHGRLMHTAEVLSGPVPLVLRLALSASTPGRILAAAVTVAGSLLTRYAWLRAPLRSATP